MTKKENIVLSSVKLLVLFILIQLILSNDVENYIIFDILVISLCVYNQINEMLLNAIYQVKNILIGNIFITNFFAKKTVFKLSSSLLNSNGLMMLTNTLLLNGKIVSAGEMHKHFKEVQIFIETIALDNLKFLLESYANFMVKQIETINVNGLYKTNAENIIK